VHSHNVIYSAWNNVVPSREGFFAWLTVSLAGSRWDVRLLVHGLDSSSRIKCRTMSVFATRETSWVPSPGKRAKPNFGMRRACRGVTVIDNRI
jgi:hypothetical protein